jgi:nitroreductase
MTTAAGPPRGSRPAGPAQSARLLRAVLEAAVAAPSMHNTQPWRFRVREPGRTVELHADPARLLAVADPDGRAAGSATARASRTARWVRPRPKAASRSGSSLRAGTRAMPGSRRTRSWPCSASGPRGRTGG